MATNNKSDAAVSIAKTTPIHPDCGNVSTQAQPATNIADKNEADKKDCRGFLFDIIVVRLDIPNRTINDSSKLSVDANFNGNNITLTSSRINVLDFKAERTFEFVANPLALKAELSRNPLTLKVQDAPTVLGL